MNNFDISINDNIQTVVIEQTDNHVKASLHYLGHNADVMSVAKRRFKPYQLMALLHSVVNLEELDIELNCCAPSYHDLYITTANVNRTSLSNLPFRVRVTCTRTGGWEVWAMKETPYPEEQLGGEYSDKWLVLDVAGYVICDSRKPCDM